MKVDILAFGAHPDDVDLCCSGTIARHVAEGRKTGIVDLTNGELGTRGNAATRLKEAKAAAKVLGVSFRENLGMKDGFLVNDKPSRMAVVRKIRAARPHIVLANALEDRHPDHAVGARLVADACFLAGLPKVKTTYKGKHQVAFRPRIVLHYIQDRMPKPDLLVDISGFVDKRMSAIMAFKSQFYDEKSREPETPISSRQFLDALEFRALEWGRMIGVPYAEGFNAERRIGIGDLFALT